MENPLEEQVRHTFALIQESSKRLSEISPEKLQDVVDRAKSSRYFPDSYPALRNAEAVKEAMELLDTELIQLLDGIDEARQGDEPPQSSPRRAGSVAPKPERWFDRYGEQLIGVAKQVGKNADAPLTLEDLAKKNDIVRRLVDSLQEDHVNQIRNAAAHHIRFTRLIEGLRIEVSRVRVTSERLGVGAYSQGGVYAAKLDADTEAERVVACKRISLYDPPSSYQSSNSALTLFWIKG